MPGTKEANRRTVCGVSTRICIQEAVTPAMANAVFTRMYSLRAFVPFAVKVNQLNNQSMQHD